LVVFLHSSGFLATLIRFVDRLPESHRKITCGYSGSIEPGGTSGHFPPLSRHQFSLRGLDAVADEWKLVAMSFNLKRMHTLKLTR